MHGAMGMWCAWTYEHRTKSIQSADKWMQGYLSMWPYIVYPIRWQVKCMNLC